MRGITKRGRTWGIAGLIGAAFATPVSAHPHVFIDSEIEVVFDAEGRAAALRITWHYDEFYSLVLVEDRGLDADYDGVLTPEENAAIQGFDMQWDPGYPGDIYPLLGDEALALGRPQDWTAEYRDGKLVSTHLRPLVAAVEVEDRPLVVQAYDPSFYVAYRIVGTPVLTGRADCTAQVFEPDPDAADAALQAAMAELSGSSDPEGAFPAVGAAYADEIRVSCAARS